MPIAGSHMKHYLIRPLILCCCVIFSFNTHAEEPDSQKKSVQTSTYADIQQLKIDIRRFNVVFYRLMNDETNSVIYKQIPIKFSAIKQEWDNLKSKNEIDAPITEKLDRLFAEYQNVTFHNKEDIYKKGYPENQLINDMLVKKTSITHTLNEVADNLLHTPSKLLKSSYKQSQLMLDIAELYGELSVSIVGNPLVSDDLNLEDMCELFNTNLNELSLISTSSGQSKHLIKSITKKWKFIEKSLRNHQKNMVPFLVARYSDTILDKLNELNTLNLKQSNQEVTSAL